MRKLLIVSSVLCWMAVAATPALAQLPEGDGSGGGECDPEFRAFCGGDSGGGHDGGGCDYELCPPPLPPKCPNGEPPDESGYCPPPVPLDPPEPPETPETPETPDPPDSSDPSPETPEIPDPEPQSESPDPELDSNDGQLQFKGAPEPAGEVALDLETEGEAEIEQAAAASPKAEPEEAPAPEIIGSPSPLKSSAGGGAGGGMGALLAIASLAAVGLFLARWIQGGSTVQSSSTSNEVVERTTDTSADAVKSFAEGRAAAKADGGAGGAASGESEGIPTETASDPIVVGWVPGKRIRLLIADGHPTVRADLRDTLESHPNFEVVGEATTGAEAVILTKRLHPRVVLMDLHAPEVDGTAATAQIKARYQDTYVLVTATQDSDADIPRAIETGASGYLLKDAPREELLEAIRAAAQGKPPLAPA